MTNTKPDISVRKSFAGGTVVVAVLLSNHNNSQRAAENLIERSSNPIDND